jgi:hypothetical protein
MLTYLQDHILSTTGDVCFTYLLTYLLTVCVWTPETKERTGDQEERREVVGLETLKSVQFTGLDTLLRIKREREREFYEQQQHDLKHEKHGGGAAPWVSRFS